MAGCGILLFVFVVFSSRLSWSKVHVGPSLGFGIPEPILSLQRRRRFADAEHGARVLQGLPNRRRGSTGRGCEVRFSLF